MTQDNPPQSTTSSQTLTQEIGYASSINDYIVWINGLPNVSINELVVSEQNAKGMVISFKENLVEVLMLDDAKIKPREIFRRTLKQLTISAGPHLIGRVINPLGQAIDGKAGFTGMGHPIELYQAPAPIKYREHITYQFETGITAVDMLMPIAFGQRELVIGDPHSGKTGFLIDTVINQRGKDVLCVYVMVGKPNSEIKKLIEILRANKALEYSVIIASSSSERAPLGFLNPLVGLSIAEHFQRKGRHILLILDDLGVHAKIYREISLLSGKAPGRQSYPGDIFYQHARLMERAGSFNKTLGGGSITALPVIEVNLEDFSGYMPTNLMGMTDGHLKFSSALYKRGRRPALDIELSVSRVGHQTQNLAQKGLADKVKAGLAEGKKLESYSHLGSDLSEQTQAALKQSRQIEAILKQPSALKIPIIVQMILLGLTFTPFFGQKDTNFVTIYKDKIISYFLEKVDLKKLQSDTANMADEKEFIKSLSALIPELEKVCMSQQQPAAAQPVKQ
jgi:F-type H+/Na+-transporting ATPase subunit alpha